MTRSSTLQARRRVLSARIQEGVVSGPWLWNIMYNEMTDLRVPNEATLNDFADDLVT